MEELHDRGPIEPRSRRDRAAIVPRSWSRDRTVITNRRRFDQQTRSRPLIAIFASSDGSRSIYIPSSGTGISRYRYRHRHPVPDRYWIHPVPYPVPTFIRYRHPELDDGFGYWIPVIGYRYRQIPVLDDGPDDDRRTLLGHIIHRYQYLLSHQEVEKVP